VLIGLVIWAALLFATGTVSIASIAAAAALPIAVWLLDRPAEILALAIVVSAFVIYAHRANIRRLMKGQEHSFRKKKEASS
jgi:glycerol-3-phosphate acyltransferase PlsY